MSFGFLLRRGVAAGAAAGVAAALIALLMVEPVIRKALVVEEARGHGGGAHEHEEPLVSRTMQVFGGMATAAVVGVLFGVIFAVVFARMRHRLPARTDFGRSVLLAAVGFGVFSLLPGLKYPANPPAVGDPATVTQRTWLYVACLLLGLLVVAAVVAVDRRLAERGLDAAHRICLDTLTALVLLVIGMVGLPPSPDAVPADVPPALLWEFRVASLTQLAVMWAGIGLTFGVLVGARSRPREAPVPIAA